MPTVRELSDPYANFMLNPLPAEATGVCSVCLTLTQGYDTCFVCNQRQRAIGALLPISYSIHRGQLHTALRGYKGSHPAAQRFTLELAAVLWRFLTDHESCLAGALRVDSFDIVTTVPSSSTEREPEHPLHRMVGTLIDHTAPRYEPLLRPSGREVPPRTVDPERYVGVRELAGESVLLIDDTWTTGANIESAVLVLREAGASVIGGVVIGRHIHEGYEDNAARLRALPRFTWDRCALED